MPPKGQQEDPDSFVVNAGSATVLHGQMYNVSQRLSTVEQQITFLEGHAEKADTKLDSIGTDITKAKTALKVVWIILGICGTACIAIWGLIGTVVLMMAKHYLHWT